MTLVDIAWSAGLFEGEGYIGFLSKSGSPRLSISMTDLDVLEKFKAITGHGVINGPITPKPGGLAKKDYYRYHTSGFEKVQSLVAMFWNFLGDRRKDQCEKVIKIAAKRGIGNRARNKIKLRDGIFTFCGHDAVKENTYINPTNKRTFCVACRKKSMRDSYLRKKHGS